MSVPEAYLAATVNAVAVAKHHGMKAFINMSQMTLSQMSITETTVSPAAQGSLARRAGAELVRPAGRAHAAKRVLEGFFLIFTSDSVRESNQIRLPFGDGKTSAVGWETLYV